MFGLFAALWLLVGTLLAGVAVIVVVTNPGLAENARMMIPMLCGGGYLLGMPVAYLVARKIKNADHAAA